MIHIYINQLIIQSACVLDGSLASKYSSPYLITTHWLGKIHSTYFVKQKLLLYLSSSTSPKICIIYLKNSRPESPSKIVEGAGNVTLLT